MNWPVQFAPEALDRLRRLEKRTANAGAPMADERYVDSIVDFCMQLKTFAARGVARDDLPPGLRIAHFRKRAIIAYVLETEVVSIVGVFYAAKAMRRRLHRMTSRTLTGGEYRSSQRIRCAIELT